MLQVVIVVLASVLAVSLWALTVAMHANRELREEATRLKGERERARRLRDGWSSAIEGLIHCGGPPGPPPPPIKRS